MARYFAFVVTYFGIPRQDLNQRKICLCSFSSNGREDYIQQSPIGIFFGRNAAGERYKPGDWYTDLTEFAAPAERGINEVIGDLEKANTPKAALGAIRTLGAVADIPGQAEKMLKKDPHLLESVEQRVSTQVQNTLLSQMRAARDAGDALEFSALAESLKKVRGSNRFPSKGGSGPVDSTEASILEPGDPGYNDTIHSLYGGLNEIRSGLLKQDQTVGQPVGRDVSSPASTIVGREDRRLY